MKNFILTCLLAISPFFALIPLSAQECTDIGTNLGDLPTVLVDVFKSSRTFWEADLVNYIWDTGTPLPLDINGYPTSINTGFGARTLFMEALEGNYPTGSYILLYDGEGTIEFGMDAQNPIFTNNGGTDNRIDFEVPMATDNGLLIDIVATTIGNHIHNIRVIRPEEAGTNFLGTYLTRPFIPTFYERLQNYKIIRFMDWMSTNWSEQQTWANRPTQQSASWEYYDGNGGVPVEIMVGIANELNTNPWFCMPHRANDNYMTQFASYVAANLNSSQKVYIEYSNEIWNGLFGDYDGKSGQSSYALDMAAANGISGWSESMGYWVGRRSGEMFDLWSNAFGDDNRLVKVIPIQTGTGGATSFTLDYVHNGTPLWQIGNAVSGQGYFEGGYQNLPLATMTANQVMDEIEAHMFDYDTSPYWARQTVLMLQSAPYNTNSLPFICYEGGQHLANWGGTPSDPVTALLIEVNRHPRMGQIYTNYLNWWRDSIGGAFVHYHNLGTYSMWGSWGELEYITQDPNTSPKYMALQNWIAANPNPCNLVFLPVELTNFYGFAKNDSNILEWKTSIEINHDYFEIEKRDAYKKDFLAIGKIVGKSSNNEGAKYRFIDTKLSSSINYYRLKQVNIDGTYTYSEIISIKNNNRISVQLLPNIVTQKTTLTIQSTKNEAANITILNLQGHVLKNYKIQIGKGFNQNELSLEDLNGGIYFLRVEQNGENQVIRFLKK